MKRCCLMLLVLCLLIGLCGCGNTGRSSAPGPADIAPAATPDDLADTPAADIPSQPPAEPVTVPEPEPEIIPEELTGILVQKHEGANFNLYLVNPTTGEQILYRSFPTTYGPADKAGSSIDYSAKLVDKKYGVLGYAQDYTLMAVQRYYADDQSYHAGWIDQNGIFYDAQELACGPAGDFADHVDYDVLGFSPSGKLVYCERGRSSNVFYVDANNPTERFVGNPIISEYLHDLYDPIDGGYGYFISDWVDDDLFLAFVNTKSDATTIAVMSASNPDYINDLLPESNRYNSCGILSPGGTQVAFLSYDYSTNLTTVFVVPLDGSTPPTKVPDSEYSGTVLSAHLVIDWL